MILIPGFEPFDNAKTNPSYEAIKLLPDTLGDIQIEKFSDLSKALEICIKCL